MGWATAAAEHLFRIRYRLLLVNALVVAVPIVGISFARVYERELLRGVEQDMIHQAQLLREMLRSDPTGLRLDQRGATLRRAARNTRTRIRLLDMQGRSLSDSGGSPTQDVDARAEVRTALTGSYGARTRLRSDGRQLELYAALPIYKSGRVVGVVYVTRSTAPVKFAMWRLRTMLFWVLLGSLLVTTVLSLFLAATISRPLSRLTRTATAIAQGDTTLTLALGRRDEIGQLAQAIDRMKNRLAERAEYTAELSANICHELKSPLTSIRGAAELLIDGADDDPRAREMFLRNIVEDTERLDRVVIRLLELARVEADRAPAEEIDYPLMLADLIGSRRGPAPTIVHYRASRTTLRARRAQLTSAIENLLDNAEQHARIGSQIEISVDDGGDATLITEVSNWGVPISPARRSDVWRRFVTTRSQHGGTGLGLSIVSSVIEAHGGRTTLRSEEDRTTFGFELPLRLGAQGV